MLLGGLWHGANWTFVIWGGIHGLYLVVNHIWRRCGAAAMAERLLGGVAYGLAAWLATMAAVVFAWVFFRAVSLHAALNMASTMVGLAAPSRYPPILDGSQEIWLPLLLAFVALLPNSEQLFRRRFGAPFVSRLPSTLASTFAWRPSFAWTCASAMLFVVGVLSMTSDSRFVYFQF